MLPGQLVREQAVEESVDLLAPGAEAQHLRQGRETELLLYPLDVQLTSGGAAPCKSSAGAGLPPPGRR
jgi:hypothetical protein